MKLENFSLDKDLRQGDPLSPYLFVSCMERLIVSIQDLVSRGVWETIHMSRGGLLMSHLLFADDVLLFFIASHEQAKVVVDTLDNFCAILSLKVNLHKSNFICSKGVSPTMKDEIEGILGIICTPCIGK